MLMKVAVIVVLYHPKEETLANILSYSKYFGKTYVFDNSPAASAVQQQLSQLAGITLFHDGQNRGISERLNAGCTVAMQEGYDWVMTMDQDTHFEEAAISNYLNCFQHYAGTERVAAFGPHYSRVPPVSTNQCLAEKVEEVITSGMLLNLSIWKKLGGLDEALFIDLLDYEYCARAVMAGYQVLQFSNVHIYHELGTEVYRSSIKSLFLKKKKKLIHSPLRYYYMYRNMLYLESKYAKTNPAFVKVIRKRVMILIKTSLFYGRHTAALFKYISKAKADFKGNRMGKIADENC